LLIGSKIGISNVREVLFRDIPEGKKWIAERESPSQQRGANGLLDSIDLIVRSYIEQNDAYKTTFFAVNDA
jgi:hypothetical protein